MVGVSYHELTAGSTKQQRHTAGQRKQFLLICVVGVAVLFNAFINAGLFEPVMIKNDGIYPGGTYVYKLLEDKDFATTGGIWRRIAEDLNLHDLTLEGDEGEKFDEILYAVYIDNLDGAFGRYFNGILIDNSKDELKDRLLALNEDNDKVDKNDESTTAQFQRLRYEVGDLPSVRCAITTFPFTDGFVSALIHNYKVFPALHKYATKNHDPNAKIVITTTCNRKLKLCRHYVPMIQSEKFLMGHPDTKEYMDSQPKEKKYDFERVLKGVKKLLGFK